MGMPIRSLFGAAVATVVFAGAAQAECKRFGFTVNDYGKEGPTRDAKDLLDKHIATKMAERGVSKFSTGTKSVNCELFLNFIIFDEHTCTAEATVCWGDSQLPADQQAKTDADGAAAKKPAKKQSATGSIEKTAAPKPEKAAEPAAEKSPAKVEKTEEPVAAPEPKKAEAPAAPVETAPAAATSAEPAAAPAASVPATEPAAVAPVTPTNP